MAYTSIHSIKATEGAALRYITNGDKTVNGVYVNSYACRADSRGAAADFRAVRANGTGRTQILAHHIIQSFAPDEVTPEQALQIGEELCDRFLKGDYQYVIAVHTDKEHTHCHVIFNNTNLYNGLSFTTEHNQGRKSERAWAELRQISDEICKEHGISVIEPKGKGVSHFERDMQKEGKSWKDKLRSMLREIIDYSRSFEDFLKNCADSGIEYVYKPSNKVKLKFKLSGEGQQRFTRADTLGEEYTPERIAEQIEQIQRIQKAPEKPVVTPKTEQKPTPPQPIVTPTEPTKSREITEEEFFALLGEPTTPETKPTESQAPEKEEDVWAAIRGMRNADTIIADLEAGGIESLDVLRSFFWNIHHSDDHTDELAKLKKKIKALNELIAKMKHHDELVPTYREYKGLSGFKQSRFKKKHSEQIEDFEQTNTYISKHNTDYYVDGKKPKLADLETLLINLATEYNALVPEHNAFLKKKAAADLHSKTVRTYLEHQKQQERDRQYKERKRTQQKKKDVLE